MTATGTATAWEEDALERIDQSVADCFERMLNLPCLVTQSGPLLGTIIEAKIVFSDGTSGSCVVEASVPAADRLTDALLGSEADWDDDILDDAIGELCNIVAGGWKSRLPAGAQLCELSVPEIRRRTPGQPPREIRPDRRELTRRYEFDGHQFSVTLSFS